jgi:hypothetical protein
VSGTDIFLSYARHDQGTAQVFAKCLLEEGFSVWWDASLHSGETFDEVIERNLREARAVVVLWSPASVASRWVRAEATLADRRNKLAPAMIEACDRPIIFELTHAAELSGWNGDRSDPRWQTFVADLHRLVEAGSHEVAAASATPARRQPPTLKAVEDVPTPADAAVSRRPLRPGNAEVILADRLRREPALRSPRPEPAVDESLADGEVHCLDMAEGHVAEEVFVVDSAMKIGRAAPADIVVSHKSVSREHCLIGLANDELLVTDLNSTNGTYIDDVRVSRAAILPVGSVLRIGQISLTHSIRARGEAERAHRPYANSQAGAQAGRVAAIS